MPLVFSDRGTDTSNRDRHGSNTVIGAREDRGDGHKGREKIRVARLS